MKLCDYKHKFSPQIDIYNRHYYTDIYSALSGGIKELFKISNINDIPFLSPVAIEHVFDITHYYHGYDIETFNCEFHADGMRLLVIKLLYYPDFKKHRISLGDPNADFWDISIQDIIDRSGP